MIRHAENMMSVVRKHGAPPVDLQPDFHPVVAGNVSTSGERVANLIESFVLGNILGESPVEEALPDVL